MNGSAGRPGASAYAALVEWENFGRLAALAPALADRIAVAEASAGALARYRAALDRLIAADHDPAAAMAGSVGFVDAARARVGPSTWWEALVVAVVWVPLVDVLATAAEDGALGAGAAADVVGDPAEEAADRDGWAVWRVREAIEADPALGARLVLWGRRLGGEAIALAADFAGVRASLGAGAGTALGIAAGGGGGGRIVSSSTVGSGAGKGVVSAPVAPARAGRAVGALRSGAARFGMAGNGAARTAVPAETLPAVAVSADQKPGAEAFAALADQVAHAHAAALAPLFGEQEQRPAGR